MTNLKPNMNRRPVSASFRSLEQTGGPTLTTTFEKEGHFTGVARTRNRAVEEISDYSAEGLVSDSNRTVIPHARQWEEDEGRSGKRNDKRVRHVQTLRQPDDGSHVSARLTIPPFRGPDGTYLWTSKTVPVIAPPTRVETQLAAAAALREGFLSLISHELRTPIAIVVGNASMLLKLGETLSPENREQAIQDIATEGARLQGVIEHLLVLTRMEGSTGLVFEPVSLRSLVAQQVQTQSRRNPDHRFEVLSSEDLPPVNGDPVLFEMVVANLLTNAIKYSPPDTVVAITLASNAEAEVELRVRDQGIGINEDELEGVFTPFYRTAEAVKRAKGMGLGLAVCKRIVEVHGGRIWAERPAGRGTEFIVSLPQLDDPIPGSAAE